jgi:membrane-bound ClpP family serine protease
MKPEILPPKQKTQTQTISLITMILIVISFLCLFYKIYAYQEIKVNTASLDTINKGIVIANFLKFFLLISMGILLYIAHSYNIRFNWLTNFTIVSGIFTFLFIYSDWAALHDIFHGESDTRLEWSFLRLGLIINFVFYIAGFITIVKIRREPKASQTDRV